MMWQSWQVVLLLMLVGCGKQPPDPGTLIVIPGQGIPKVAELGMSINEIQNTVPDLQIESYPMKGFPWQKNSIGDRLRLPWEKPLRVVATSSSLGLGLSAGSKSKPVQELRFLADPNSALVSSNTCFTGQLSGGLSFANRRRVTRAEVTALFGEPSVHGVGLPEGGRLMQAGTNVSIDIGIPRVEMIFYPTNGISFCLMDGVVSSFSVREKIKKVDPKP